MSKSPRYESRQVSLTTGELLCVFKWDTQRDLFRFMSQHNGLRGTVMIGVRLADNVIVQYRGKCANEFLTLMQTTQRLFSVLCTPVGWTHADA